MPVLSEDSVLIMDGAVKLYRRERSRHIRVRLLGNAQSIITGGSICDAMMATGELVRARAGANMPISTLTLVMCIKVIFGVGGLSMQSYLQNHP